MKKPGHVPGFFVPVRLQGAALQPCGSGFTREEPNAVDGTGCAGVRG